MHCQSCLLTSVFNGVSQPLKRRNGYENNEVESSEWSANLGYSDMVNSPFHSSKRRKDKGPFKVMKNNRSVPSILVSDVGETCSPRFVIFCLPTSEIKIMGALLDLDLIKMASIANLFDY